MKRFLKDNLVLVAGIVLPLALILFFYIAGVVARATVPDPQYDMVFAAEDYLGSWQVGLVNDALTISYASANHVPSKYVPGPKLYLFDHKTMTVEPLSINYDHIVDGVVQDPTIEKLNTHILSAGRTSPDGYYLADGSYDGGLFSVLFDFGDNGSASVLRKQGRTIPLAGAPPYYGNNRFIVWVDGKKP